MARKPSLDVPGGWDGVGPELTGFMTPYNHAESLFKRAAKDSEAAAVGPRSTGARVLLAVLSVMSVVVAAELAMFVVGVCQGGSNRWLSVGTPAARLLLLIATALAWRRSPATRLVIAAWCALEIVAGLWNPQLDIHRFELRSLSLEPGETPWWRLFVSSLVGRFSMPGTGGWRGVRF